MNDLIDSLLIMRMDVYKQIDFQDPSSGQLRKEWQYDRTVPCHAKGIISNSSSSRTGGDKQLLSNKYSNEQIIQVRTIGKIGYREKITNLCDSEGSVIWVESNFPTDTPTVFEVMGTTPITDLFGSVIGYNTTIKRSENQVIGL